MSADRLLYLSWGQLFPHTNTIPLPILNDRIDLMTLTAGVVIFTVVSLGLYDLLTIVITGKASSISIFLQSVGFKSPLVVFMFGFLMGHFFAYIAPQVAPVEKTMSRILKNITGPTPRD